MVLLASGFGEINPGVGDTLKLLKPGIQHLQCKSFSFAKFIRLESNMRKVIER